MQQLEESKAEANAAVIVSLLPSVIGDSTDINLKAMKDREIELVGAKVKARKNEEVCLISSKSELWLTPFFFLVVAHNNRGCRSMSNLHGFT